MANLFMFSRGLGATIFASGIVDHYKDEPSVIVTGAQTAPLFEDLPNLERLIIRDKLPWQKHWLHLWQDLRRTSWDHIFALKGGSVSLFMKARKKHIWVHRAFSLVHKVNQASSFAGSKTPLRPAVWISETRLARMKPKRPTLAVSPIPSWVGKQWPIEDYITLLTKFCKTYPDAQVAIFAAPNERDRVLPLFQALPKDQCIDTIGGHLLDSAALIKWSRVFIGNDSGLMHISAAVRTPTIGLFGPTNERIFGPWSDETPSPHRIVRSGPYKGPLRGYMKQDPKDTNCYMADLSVETVWEVLQERWENAQNPELRMSA